MSLKQSFTQPVIFLAHHLWWSTAFFSYFGSDVKMSALYIYRRLLILPLWVAVLSNCHFFLFPATNVEKAIE
jgi:hypothetical protein